MLYPYTSDLLCLEFCRLQDVELPQELAVVQTPLVVDAWASALQPHPDRAFARYIKWRLITDQSFPPGQSVNDGIDPALCSLAYTTVDQVAEVVARLGTAALLAKVDIESAYRLIPVHPQDRPLQAVCWEGQVFIDPMFPFGLRSAPKIFNAVADALNWLLHQRGIPHVLHYLDDFIIISPPHSGIPLSPSSAVRGVRGYNCRT